ncbi:MAG: hypothetical protein JRI95_05235 [Deltaproteobacteria bacterium]|nr:hypothetical protein [Deltaproteobacteria bacterium]
MKKFLTSEELEGRLNCFGEFDESDRVCLKHCALNINCAIAKNEYFNFQFMNDSISSIIRFDTEYNN